MQALSKVVDGLPWPLLGVALALLAVLYYSVPRKERPETKPDHLLSYEDIPIPSNTKLADQETKCPWPQTHVTWLKWSKECGHKGILRIDTGDSKKRMVLLTDPTLVAPIYAKLPKDLAYSNFHYMLSKKLPLGEGIFSSFHTDKTWAATRKHIAPFFSIPNLRAKVPIIKDKALVLCQKLKEYGPDKPVDAQNAMKRLTLDTFLPAGGFRFEMHALDFQRCQFLEDLQAVFWEVAMCSYDPWRRWKFNLAPWRSKEARNFVDTHDRLYAMWDFVWAKMEEAPEPVEGDLSLTACFRRFAASPEGRRLRRNTFVWSVGGMLMAGLDSQGLTLSFTLMLLAAHPHKQALAARELRQRGLLATPERPEPRDVTADDLPTLTYIDAVIKESTRLLPVTGLGTSRRTEQGMDIGGFWVPKNTVVQVPGCILHQDTKSFAEPESYIPERWLPDLSPEAITQVTGVPHDQLTDDTIKAVHKERQVRQAAEADPDKATLRLKFRNVAFAHGPRGCPGLAFATQQLQTVLAVLLGRFEVSLAPQMGGWEGCRAKELNAFTLLTIGGNWLQFKPRVT